VNDSTFLAFDYGTRRIGVAVGNSITGTANALDTIAARDGQPDWDAVTRLIEAWQPTALVVGRPLNMDDSENDMTRLAARFANRLRGRYRLPVIEIDERLSSRSAMAELEDAGYTLRRIRDHIDSHAAREILQTHLNNLNSQAG